MNLRQRLGLTVALLALTSATIAQTTNAPAPQPEIPAIGRLPDTDDGLPG